MDTIEERSCSNNRILSYRFYPDFLQKVQKTFTRALIHPKQKNPYISWSIWIIPVSILISLGRQNTLIHSPKFYAIVVYFNSIFIQKTLLLYYQCSSLFFILCCIRPLSVIIFLQPAVLPLEFPLGRVCYWQSQFLYL